jgi:hypothetical protein
VRFCQEKVLTSNEDLDTCKPIILRMVLTFSTVKAPDRSESNLAQRF